VPFLYGDLERAISPERARRYLTSTVDPRSGVTDPARAVMLYEHNTRLSAAAWSTICDVEVVLRNVIARAVSDLHATHRPAGGLRWYDEPTWFATGRWFTTQTLTSIAVAMKRAGDPGPRAAARPSAGRVIAELSLGFWRYLLVSRYEHSLWNPGVRSQFPALSGLSGSDSRKRVHERVEALNYLRNRVAHHEPVYETFSIPGPRQLDAVTTLHESIELVEWADPDAGSWIRERSTYAEVAASI